MGDQTATTCARHPGTQTRLFCSQCGTPICPRCAVATPVGQKCPDCARQAPAARRQGKPRQYAKGIGAGAVVAGVSAFLLQYLWAIPLVSFFAAFGVGLGVAEAVRWGAEGNRNPVFRNAALVLSLGAIAGALVIAAGTPLPSGLSLLSYLVAGYGAWTRF